MKKEKTRWKQLADLYPDYFSGQAQYAYHLWNLGNRIDDAMKAATRADSPRNPNRNYLYLLIGTLHLAAEGYDIIATGRRSERLESLRREIEAAGGRCTTLTFDVRSEEAVRRNLEPLGRVDLLVNNAGLAAGLEHIDKGDTADWDAMIDTNVKGLLYVTRVITPKMVAAGGGHVFNIGSIAGTEPYENGAVYCASKHAVHAISQAMRADLLANGIKVTEIRPGMVETEFSEVRFHGDKERADRVYDGVEPLTGEDIAEAIAWAAQLPAHMTVNEMVLMPSQQAGAYYTHRKN